MRSATLKDVAKLAGVSTATVSYVVNNSRGVSDAVRQKVEDAVRALDYVPNQQARNFKNGKHNSIGFIVPDIANIYFSEIIEEVESVLNAEGINLIIANTKETPENERNQIRNLSNGLVDGLILATTIPDYSQISAIVPENFPIVMVDRGISDCTTDKILISSETAMVQGITALVSEGCTKIGHLAGLKHIYTTESRKEEYFNSLEQNHLAPDPSIIRYTDSSTESIYKQAQSLLDSGCDAIVAGNNIITMHLVNLSLRNSMEEKPVFRILGYDYDGMYAWFPFLKIMSVPTRDLGRLSIRRLLARIEDPALTPKEYILSCTCHHHS